MEFSRPEQAFLFPGDVPNPGIEPRSPTLQADILPAELPVKPIFVQLQILQAYICTTAKITGKPINCSIAIK